jgi:protein TonB
LEQLPAEQKGTVRIQFIVGTDNQLIAAKVVQSSGYKNLDKATVNALSHCKFKVGYIDGKPVQSSFTADYAWRLDE